MSDNMTKTERAELKSVVRQQFKVLRSEVEQREAEVAIEITENVASDFAESDKRWEDAKFLAQEATNECNRKVNDLFREAAGQPKEGYEYVLVQMQIPARSDAADRHKAQAECRATLNANVKAARLRLDREEADLLKRLAIGALSSGDARSFLEVIPTVGELVPAARLAQMIEGTAS